MTSDYEEYERACRVIRNENQAMLKDFCTWMESEGLSEETVRRHLSNAALYIQEFLLYEQPGRPHEGISSVGMFLGYWFIRKAPVATPGTVKSSATSLIKFYSYLVEKGLVTREKLDGMRQQIKHEMAQWQERARRYNHPAINDPSKIWI